MPSHPAGRRRVRCPKCTALLTEPQTQIYECPICATLLLAKGYGFSRSPDNRVHASNGDAEDIQRILDGGAKLEKASLISDVQEQQRKENADSDKNRDLVEKGSALQPELIDERTPPASHTSSDPRSQHVSTELISGLVPESAALLSESSAGTPHRALPSHFGEAPPHDEFGHHFSDLDSVSPSESEAYLDSPLWSSENANASEVQDASSLVDSLTASSHADSSYEHVSTVTSLKDSNSGKGGHLRMSTYISGIYEEKGPDLDSRNRTKEALGVTNSANTAFKEDCESKETINGKLDDNGEADVSFTSSFDPNDNGHYGNKSSVGKGTARELSKDSKSDGGHMEMPNVGKFRLFDLSVFGIYNEDTYNELRRGKAAHYTRLAEESGNGGDSLQPSANNEPVSRVPDIAARDHSAEEESLEAQIDENVTPVVHADVTEPPVANSEGSYCGTEEHREMHFNSSQGDTDGRSLGPFRGEVVNDGLNSLEGDSHRDNDALAEARYGDIPTVRELRSEASIDISFGDWRSEQVVKPSQRALEPDPDAEFDTDSSWEDDEELTFSSPAKGDSEPKGTGLIGEDAEGPPGAKETSAESQAKKSVETASFPLRTTAMQTFLHRDDKQSAAQTQSSHGLINADSALYEAPYIEHYTPPPERHSDETSDKTLVPSITLYSKEHDSHADALEDTDKETAELQIANPPSGHSSPASTAGASRTPVHWKEKDEQSVLMQDVYPRKNNDSVTSSQRHVTGEKMDKSELEMAALASQKLDNVSRWHTNKLGNASGKPVSLRWKGKGSSTQSISSTEDEGAYGMESEAGSGPEKDPFREGGVGLVGGPFPEEGTFGIGQQPRDPSGRLSQRTWMSNMDVNRQRHTSGELATSRRTTRSRPSNERLSIPDPFMGADDRLHVEGRSFIPESLGTTGLDRSAELSPAYRGSGFNPNRGRLDQGSNYSYNGMADYSSDHSSRSQDVPPRSQYDDYRSNMYGSSLGVSTRPYPCQVPSHDSLPLQEQGLPHLAHTHHGVSPACSLCIQQQYFMQQPQMLQNTMLHSCAACAAQVSAAAYQPMHHDIHGHHVHGLAHSDPSLKHHEFGALPAQSRRQNRAGIQHNHPVLPARRTKHYPPLPEKGAPPYVLCKECNQLLQVPEYLPPISGSVQRLRCGACGKTSKFSIPQASNKWPPSTTRVSVNSSGLPRFVARDKMHTDFVSVFSSEQRSSSGGVPSVQSLYGNGRHISGQGLQHAWPENRVSSQPNVFGIPPIQSQSVEPRHQPRPMMGTTGAGEAPYGSHVRHARGDYLASDAGLHKEDYFSSSPSSASGASPRRYSQVTRDNQQVEHLATGRDSPHGVRVERFELSSKAASLHTEPADAGYSGINSARHRTERVRKLPVVPGSPLIEHFTQDAEDAAPPAQNSLRSGNGSRSAPWSPKSESRLSPPFDPYSNEEFSERPFENDPLQLPVQDGSKGPKTFKGLLKRSIKDLGKGGQGGGNRRKVVVNGYLIPEAAVRRAEERAGPIHSGTYWYDYQAGFWGVMGGPCLGILMPFIEEFHFPLSRDCAGGKTGILVNGRELHERDLDVLAKRGLPTTPGKAYILDISGALFDDVSSQPLKGLGKLAPSIEKRGRGFGMSPATAES